MLRRTALRSAGLVRITASVETTCCVLHMKRYENGALKRSVSQTRLMRWEATADYRNLPQSISAALTLQVCANSAPQFARAKCTIKAAAPVPTLRSLESVHRSALPRMTSVRQSCETAVIGPTCC